MSEAVCPYSRPYIPTAAELEFYESIGQEPPKTMLLNPADVDGYEPNVQDNSDVFRGLRTITDSLAAVAIADTFEDLKNKEAKPVASYALPYEMSADLQATDFPRLGTFMKTPGGLRYQSPSLPSTVEGKNALAEQYLAYSKYSAIYRETYEAHKVLGTEDNFLGLCTYRIRESSKHREGDLEEFEGRFSRFVFAKPNIESMDNAGLPEVVVMPIGEYGEDFARKVLNATCAVLEAFSRSSAIDKKAAEVASPNKKLLAEYTARGKSEYMTTGEVTGAAPKATLLEGVLSAMQVMAWLTAEKVEGYEDPDELFNAIVDAGLIEQVTRKVTMGTVGPTIVKGVYPKQPLSLKDGMLELGDSLLHILGKRKEDDKPRVVKRMIEKYNYDKLAPGEIVEDNFPTGIMCPAAGKNGAVRQSTNAIQAAFNR